MEGLTHLQAAVLEALCSNYLAHLVHYRADDQPAIRGRGRVCCSAHRIGRSLIPSYTVARMEKLGLIKAVRITDTQATVYEITDAGRSAIQEVHDGLRKNGHPGQTTKETQ